MRFSFSLENERADADKTAEPVSRDLLIILRREWCNGVREILYLVFIVFPFQLTQGKEDWLFQ